MHKITNQACNCSWCRGKKYAFAIATMDTTQIASLVSSANRATMLLAPRLWPIDHKIIPSFCARLINRRHESCQIEHYYCRALSWNYWNPSCARPYSHGHHSPIHHWSDSQARFILYKALRSCEQTGVNSFLLHCLAMKIWITIISYTNVLNS